MLYLNYFGHDMRQICYVEGALEEVDHVVLKVLEDLGEGLEVFPDFLLRSHDPSIGVLDFSV